MPDHDNPQPRDVACPYCGADPGEHCRTMNGNLTGRYGTRVDHYRRQVAARRAAVSAGSPMPDLSGLSARVGALPDDWRYQLAAELAEMDLAARLLRRHARRLSSGDDTHTRKSHSYPGLPGATASRGAQPPRREVDPND